MSAQSDRRRAATNRLVVLDLESLTHRWSDIVTPDDLLERSVLLSALLAARRESDTFLIGCEPSFGWALSEVFPGAALFLGSGRITEDRPLVAEFVKRFRSGEFSDVSIVSLDERLIEAAQALAGADDPIAVYSTREQCQQILGVLSGSVVMKPDFVLGLPAN